MSLYGGHSSAFRGLVRSDMARNRYLKDYRIVETVDERGRIHSSYEYIGDNWFFQADPKTLDRAKKLILALSVLCLALWLGAMLPESRAMRTWYTSFPFAFLVLPLTVLLEQGWSLYRCKEPMEHRLADQLSNRYPPRCLAAAVLAGLVLIGQAVSLLRGLPMTMGDLIFSLGDALILGAAVLLFRERKTLATRKG